MDTPHFPHSSVDGHLHCFHLFIVTKNNATKNIHVHVFVWTYVSFILDTYT